MPAELGEMTAGSRENEDVYGFYAKHQLLL